MSESKFKASKELPDIYLTESSSRNKTLGGFLHRRTNSAGASFSSSGIDVAFDSTTSKTFYSTIGPSFSGNTRNLSLGAWINAIKFSRTGKLNKLPRPERTQIIFDAISRGLKDSILLAQNETCSSKLAFDNVSVSSIMQIKLNERYLKKLEFHLSKLEELKEQYDVQHKIRDGIRTMGYAYILSPGKLKETALQSVKSEFKECTDVMCAFESNLQSLMGTLSFEMLGIQGFARICCGDVFEVIVKHGDQKWKTRGRVIKNGDQMWENKSFVFKSLFDEPLCIKAMEVRGLGKNILLGNKFCETRDLFCAHPQQMTINLNPSGSLKLNLLITWNPLSNSADGIPFVSVPSSTLLSHSCGLHSVSHTSIRDAEQLSDLSLSEKEVIISVPRFCDNKASFSLMSESILSPDSIFASPTSNVVKEKSPVLVYNIAQNGPNDLTSFNDSKYLQPILPKEENTCVNGTSSDRCLAEVLKTLSIALDDTPKDYPETQELSLILDEIIKTLKERSQNDSDSNISISIENALGCFDFLDTAIENDETENASERTLENNEGQFSKKCRICHSDMMIRKNLETVDTFSLSNYSGNEDINLLLLDHLLLCEKYLSSLTSFSRVKCVEVAILKKLQQQIYCLTNVLLLLTENSFCLCEFFDDSENDARQIWSLISEKRLYCSANHFSFELENVLKTLKDVESNCSSTVAQHLASDIMDVPFFEPTFRVSVFQFKNYFSKQNVYSKIHNFISGLHAAEDLKCKDIQKAFNAVSELSKIVPSSYSLFQIGSLLIDSDTDLKNVAISYFKAVCSNEDLKEKIISSCLLMLQSENDSSKVLSCKVIKILQTNDCFEQLKAVPEDAIGTSIHDIDNCVLDKSEYRENEKIPDL